MIQKVEYVLKAILIMAVFLAASIITTFSAKADTLSVLDDSSRIISLEKLNKITTEIVLGPGIVVNCDEDLKLREVPASKSTEAAANPYQTINITDAEFNELRWVVALEAQGEGFNGEKAVIEAIFNRVLSSKDWGNSIHEVLAKKGQFATYKYIGSKKAWATPGELEDNAISEVLRTGPSILPSMKYVFFDSKGGVNGRNHIRIGNHTFGAEK